MVATGRKPSSRRSTATPQESERLDTQNSEFIPSQILPIGKNATSPTLRKQVDKKRKSPFNNTVPRATTTQSSISNFFERQLANLTERVTPPIAKIQSDSDASPEPVTPKKRRLNPKVIEDSQPELLVPISHQPQDLIELASAPTSELRTQTPAEPQKEAPPQSPSKNSPSPRETRSKQPSPSRLTPPRQRSISPVTKVDSWLYIGSGSNYRDEVTERTNIPPAPETPHTDTLSQINDHPPLNSVEPTMNPSGNPTAGATGPTFTPIQALHRQSQGSASRTGTPGPAVSTPAGRPLPLALRSSSISYYVLR